jgi:hypothetical protein
MRRLKQAGVEKANFTAQRAALDRNEFIRSVT